METHRISITFAENSITDWKISFKLNISAIQSEQLK